MSPADWIGVSIFIIGVVLTAATAYFQSRRAAEPDPEALDRGEARALALTPEDRALLTSLRDAMKAMTLSDADRRILLEVRDLTGSLRDVSLQLGRRIDAGTDEMAELGRAIKSNTAALDR